MNRKQQFWLAQAGIAAVTVLILTFAVRGCVIERNTSVQEQALRAEYWRGKADGMKARCER